MILEFLILALAIPVGFLIAYLCRDELAAGKKYFRVLIILGALGVIGFWLYGFPASAWTSGFMGVVGLISFVKGK